MNDPVISQVTKFFNKFELAYRIPGKGGWKRKEFTREADRAKFMEKVIAKEGDDVEFETRD